MDPWSSSYNWVYDVFPSFSGEDVRLTFLSHLLKELDRKMIIAFKDNEIPRGQSLDPELKQAIRDSRIAVVVFSKNYASSTWCLNELLEIVQYKEEFGRQMVIPVFYDLDPSHVRKQTGDFGKIFQETCKNKTEDVINRWKKALTDVANILGYHSVTQVNEAKMIEEIANDVSGKLLLTTSKDFEDFVGIEDHIANMSELLELESEEVRMLGIWGSSGIGKTTIARTLFNRISRHFQGSIFIDRAFISKSMESYSRANPDDYNMKLHLQGNFLSKLLKKKDIEINHLGALEERLKHQKVLIFIDDLDDLMVLEVLAGQTQWFGCGSRIIVVTTDKYFLTAHDIDLIYEVGLPPIKLALEMFCRSAFKQKYPPDGLMEFASEVVNRAGSLPLGLNVLGSSLRGLNKDDCMNMLPRFRRSLDGKIEKTLRVSYDGLSREEDKAIFRHISCLFNHVETKDIKLFLADSELDVNIGLKNLVDKCLIHERWGKVEMHCLLEEMGRNIVRIQSIDKPERREFLVDSKDICDVLTRAIGTQKVLGISLDTCEIDELHVHENAFKGMRNIRFLEIKKCLFKEEVNLHLPESFDYLPPKLKLLCWPDYPMRSMPTTFSPKNLIKIKMQFSKLEKLWEGVASLTCLKEMDLYGCAYLKEIPDLAMAANLETLILVFCVSLVKLSSSVQNLNKLTKLDMKFCESLETLPTFINLKSLNYLDLDGCLQLRNLPEISTKISKLILNVTAIEQIPCNLRLENLVELQMRNLMGQKLRKGVQPFMPLQAMLSPTLTMLQLESMPSLVELPSSFQSLNQLKYLHILYCRNLETLPTGINLQSLDYLSFEGCSRLRSFPEISTNISSLDLDKTAIEEVPWWIEKFSNLTYLHMNRCSRLKCVSLHISKLKHLKKAYFYDCGALTRVDLSGYESGVEMMEADNMSKEASSSLPDSCVPYLNFGDCFNLDPETILRQQSIIFNYMIFPGKEVPSYFTHRTTGISSLTIPLLHVPLSQPIFRFWVGAVVTNFVTNNDEEVHIKVKCEFKGICGNSFDVCSDLYVYTNYKVVWEGGHMLTILDCRIPLNEDNAPLAQRDYDHVDMQIDASDDCIKGWGIRLLEDCSSPENQLGNLINIKGLVKSGDSNVETERSRKRMRIM